jgi:hypothetical protein
MVCPAEVNTYLCFWQVYIITSFKSTFIVIFFLAGKFSCRQRLTTRRSNNFDVWIDLPLNYVPPFMRVSTLCGLLPNFSPDGVLSAVMLIMVLIIATPISTVIFQDMLGVTDEVLVMVRETLWVLCVIPVIVTLRNYFHSLSLIDRRTGSMAVAAVARNTSIWVACWLLYRCKMLTHVTAGAVLALGFATETIVVSLSAFLVRRSGWRVSAREDSVGKRRDN